MSYTQLSSSKPAANKEHRCTWCGEKILTGEKHVKTTGVYDGELQTNRFHFECDRACLEEARCDPGFEFTPYDNERPAKCQEQSASKEKQG
ncbi:DUF7576 family protein [Caballeronia grimmiae]|uniref:Uncharacterized protein n=1 Tax=Caballeronia grimmiae TaxID=1071679 RepID=A0A069P2K4_9BURK|nr:hypothetical protein [Caballeronia grimmiae]KDR34828.1 hypothetical protein BG57_04055 [Caballeronia grimmiae]GGD63056.1 hypothetical protein GCM10010985_16450 [Caballeronia grimmiae]